MPRPSSGHVIQTPAKPRHTPSVLQKTGHAWQSTGRARGEGPILGGFGLHGLKQVKVAVALLRPPAPAWRRPRRALECPKFRHQVPATWPQWGRGGQRCRQGDAVVLRDGVEQVPRSLLLSISPIIQRLFVQLVSIRVEFVPIRMLHRVTPSPPRPSPAASARLSISRARAPSCCSSGAANRCPRCISAQSSRRIMIAASEHLGDPGAITSAWPPPERLRLISMRGRSASSPASSLAPASGRWPPGQQNQHHERRGTGGLPGPRFIITPILFGTQKHSGL